MKELKEKRGITLIALVITIIVLLILAGVTVATLTVATLTGDNGLLIKAGEAKEKNQEATALEKVKTEAAGSYNLEGKLDLSQLKTNLKRLNIPDEDILPTIKDEKETFPVVVKINGYSIDVLADGTVDKTPDFETLESLYGKVVNGYAGYTATDVTEWKLLYVDEENRDAFIISSSKLTAPKPKANGIPIVSDSGVQYTGSNSVASFEYGKKYNKLWLQKCVTESTNVNAKATAYMCDPSNWRKYVTGKAKYATGGPTIEILVASRHDCQINDLINSPVWNQLNITDESGYQEVLTNALSNVKNKLYDVGAEYWTSSPCCKCYNGTISLRIVGRRNNPLYSL